MRAAGVGESDGARRGRGGRAIARANRSPSRPASPRRSNGPKPQRCWNERERVGPKPSADRIGVLIKDEEDLVHVVPKIDSILVEAGA